MDLISVYGIIIRISDYTAGSLVLYQDYQYQDLFFGLNGVLREMIWKFTDLEQYYNYEKMFYKFLINVNNFFQDIIYFCGMVYLWR